MRPSRGMGVIAPSKVPKTKSRPSSGVAQYKKGGKAAGRQFVAQPKSVAKKTARFR